MMRIPYSFIVAFKIPPRCAPLRCSSASSLNTSRTALYLGAIAGLVPARMVQCIASLLDFAYLARCSEHDTNSLEAMDTALEQFHTLREVFREAGVRDNFALLRQHALVHYVDSIRKFGSPNGLCSSIMESKHISAVKETWRRSSRHDPIDQMVRCLTRLSKIAATCVEFGHRGMLQGDVLTAARLALGDQDTEDTQALREDAFQAAQAVEDEHDAHDVDHMDTSINLAARQGILICCCDFFFLIPFIVPLGPSPMSDTIQAHSTVQSGERGVKVNSGPGAPEGALRVEADAGRGARLGA